MRAAIRFLIVALMMTPLLSGTTIVRRTAGGAPPSCEPSVIGGLLNETWNGTTEDNTWATESGGTGTVDDDDTTNPPLTTVSRFCTQQVKFTVSSNGRRSLRADLCSGSPGWCDGTPALSGTFYVRFYFVLAAEALVDTGHFPLVSVNDDGVDAEDNQDYGISIQQIATDDLQLGIRANGAVRDTYDLPNTASATTKYRVEFVFTTSTGAWEWWVDGVSQGTGTNSFTPTPRYLHIGWGRATATVTGTLYVDNIAVSQSPIGD